MQRPRDKQIYHVPAATDTHAKVEVLLEIVFYSVRANGFTRRTVETRLVHLCDENHERRVEARVQALLEAVDNKPLRE
jgi:hypothetical protein